MSAGKKKRAILVLLGPDLSKLLGQTEDLQENSKETEFGKHFATSHTFEHAKFDKCATARSPSISSDSLLEMLKLPL